MSDTNERKKFEEWSTSVGMRRGSRFDDNAWDAWQARAALAAAPQVREPLSAKAIDEAACAMYRPIVSRHEHVPQDFPEWCLQFARTIERAHGIGA